jgi:hypothetical protein
MGLLDDALAAAKLPGPTCAVQRILTTMPEHADDLTTMLRQRHQFTSAMIETAARRNGLEGLSRFVIERHRHGQCRTCTALGVQWDC